MPVWRLPRALPAVVVVFAALVGACGSSAELPDAVRNELDVPGSSLAVLSDETSEQIPLLELAEATTRAEEIGVELRIVIAGDEQQLVDAKALADRYGGTALSYRSGDVGFEAASANMATEQLNRAVSAAGIEGDKGASALAFVRVLEREGLQTERTEWVRTLLVALAATGGLLLLYLVRRYRRARRRAEKQHDELVERREMLADWAARLGADADQLALLEGRLDPMTAAVLQGSREMIGRVHAGVQAADTLGELDMAEIRLARVAIKLRNVRQQLV